MIENPLVAGAVLVLAAVYALVVFALAFYGMHSLWLVIRYLRHRHQVIPLPLAGDDVPTVLVQLPVYNERDVVTRLVETVGKLDWPRSRLRIQLLDDSTDESTELGAAAIAALQAQGLDAQHIRRPYRVGFKAGALEYGLKLDAGHRDGAAEYVAIFDADFVPKTDFLRHALATLVQDPGLAFVQGRWEHLNPQANFLTRAQAMGIDGHFAVEQGARAWSGLPLNFNGTCGVWRTTAIAAGGGWEHDTLTEDMDLSYRVQLAGWRAAYRQDLAVPGELPSTLEAWRAQQFRWAKGSLQTARKLLGRVWASPWSWSRKCGATMHMTHYLVHPLILISLILAPVAFVGMSLLPRPALWIGVGFLLAGMVPPILLYIVSQVVLRRPLRGLRALPALAALGTGIAISNSRAALQALRGITSAFIRTPKSSNGTSSYRSQSATGIPELFAATWGVLAITTVWYGASPWMSPILGLYVTGFAHHGFHLLIGRHRERRAGQVHVSTAVSVAHAQKPSAPADEAEPVPTTA